MLNKAYINLEVLRENALAIKSKLNAGVKFCAVVKSDGYGHGAPKVASAIYDLVDAYAVALLEEAVELRLSGINKDVLVLIPFFEEDVERAVYYHLTATVYNKEQVDMLEREGERTKSRVKVHLKFNSGMNRQGVDGLENLENLVKYICKCKWVELDGMYSHFAFPEHKKAKRLAENKFLLANKVVKRYNNKATCHISASGGFLTGAQYDMVRIGLLLYGYKPFESDYVKVRPVMKVYANSLCQRELKKGESALYGNFPADGKTRISLIRYGYADGLPRKVSSGQFNNRCMDVTAVYGDLIKGEFPIMTDADEVAKKYDTISYEILVGVSRRAQKIYYDIKE